MNNLSLYIISLNDSPTARGYYRSAMDALKGVSPLIDAELRAGGSLVATAKNGRAWAHLCCGDSECITIEAKKEEGYA